MFKYKSHCRFNLLIALQNKIIEVRPGELVVSDVPLDYPNLVLIEDPKKVKANANQTDNR